LSYDETLQLGHDVFFMKNLHNYVKVNPKVMAWSQTSKLD